MKRYESVCRSVRPSSVRPSMGPQQQTHCGLRPAADIDRLKQQRRANAGSGTLSAYVGGRTLSVCWPHVSPCAFVSRVIRKLAT